MIWPELDEVGLNIVQADPVEGGDAWRHEHEARLFIARRSHDRRSDALGQGAFRAARA